MALSFEIPRMTMMWSLVGFVLVAMLGDIGLEEL
jgi:hypothetical protein